jgi:hypothetical protein
MVVETVAAGQPVGDEGKADQAGADDQGGEPVQPVEDEIEATGAVGTLCYAPKHLIARWRPTFS